MSVLSGVLWLTLGPDSPNQDQQPNPRTETQQGKYRFELVRREEGSRNCQSISTSKIAEYFAQHSCAHFTRALYTTTLPGGEQVLTSVVTAKMGGSGVAAQLEQLTTRNATGNIQDLVSAGRSVPDDFPGLSHDYGYASQQQGQLVVIGESAYFERPDHEDARLKKVTVDALRLGWPQDKAPD
ncbi:hypothetical protein FHX42_000679 [Saccharopolyspora lacisalsi]|uniref:Uncharacterized protein n=1 Tax=Halosaccharopolyspora lacisalsi TaxID=1000566 RepID=A0A839DQW1_9PSEU|nr:hypothetical protein [Halosaccharopolyspora lacisalsi]MBA8823350.1 hypothetical protein [Halosaccharopolyspora lacisalsi]